MKLGSQTQTDCTWRHGDHVEGKNNGKKVFWDGLIRLLSKTWATFLLFWHQNGRPIKWVLSKNLLPKLEVIIKKRSLPLVAYFKVNMWSSKMTLFREMSYIHITVNIDRRNFKYPNNIPKFLDWFCFHVLNISWWLLP